MFRIDSVGFDIFPDKINYFTYLKFSFIRYALIGD